MAYPAIIRGPIIAAGMILGVAVAANAQDFMSPMGPVAEAQYDHLIGIVLISLVVVLPVFIGVPLILWRYRRSSKRSAYAPNWQFSRPLEFVLWGVPILVVIVLSWQLWQTTFKLDPYRPLGPDSLQVQVIGLDFKWLFLFPDQQIGVVGELVLPESRPVSMALTTDTVMQSFLVPALAGQIFAMPGMTTELNLEGSRLGEAFGLNSQFSGIGVAEQRFNVRIVSAEDWDAWAASAHANGVRLDAASYSVLAQRGNVTQARRDLGLSGDGPITFRLDDPLLFEQVVGRYHTGRPVSPEQQPGTESYRPEAAELGGHHGNH